MKDSLIVFGNNSRQLIKKIKRSGNTLYSQKMSMEYSYIIIYELK